MFDIPIKRQLQRIAKLFNMVLRQRGGRASENSLERQTGLVWEEKWYWRITVLRTLAGILFILSSGQNLWERWNQQPSYKGESWALEVAGHKLSPWPVAGPQTDPAPSGCQALDSVALRCKFQIWIYSVQTLQETCFQGELSLWGFE